MNLTMLLDMAADGFGDRVLIGHREDGLTAAALQSMSFGGAELARAAGADAILYLAVNGPAFPVALFSAARAGIPLVPVNYRLGQEQLDKLVANHPNAIGIAGPDEMDVLVRGGIKTIMTTDEWLAETGKGVTDPDAIPADDDKPAVIIYTSGTTSEPKGVLLKHDNLTSYVFDTVEFMGAGEEEATLVSVPPYHIAAVANVISNLYSGRRSIVLESFTPKQWLELVRDQGVTNAMVVPTMLARILDAEGDLSVPTLRALAYGGAPMPGPIIERALRIWPELDFVNAYGLTETSSTIAVLGPDDHRAAFTSDDPAVKARLFSAGQVVPAIEMEIRDPEGNVVGPNVSGRIWVAGPQVSGEYAGMGSNLDARGFFDTRDQGRLDDGGYLFIEGRADDTIIRGAENISPAEIEDVLLRHPDVVDVVVVGVPDEEWGQRIEAAVVPRGNATTEPEELRAYVRKQLRGSKTPDRIVYWDELPRTETGKLVRRHALTRLLDEAKSDAVTS